MSMELYDSDVFEFDYPIWTMHESGRAEQGRVYFRGVVLPDHGEVCPFFTDFDLAKRFLEISKNADAEPLPVKDGTQAATVGEFWIKRGVRYASIDLSLIPTSNGMHRMAGSLLDLNRLVKVFRTGLDE